MAPHTKLIAEALTSAALGEIAERIFTSDSGLRRWFDEVSQPPEDAKLQARKTYTGIFYVMRNRIRRALVLEHRTEGHAERGAARRPDYFRQSTVGSPRHIHLEEDDDFPGFG